MNTIPPQDPVFNIRILDGSPEGSLVDPLVEHPLYMEAVDHALSLCDEDVPPHIKLHLEWQPSDKEKCELASVIYFYLYIQV